MNLDDLRAELDARANDLDMHASGRMAGIRAKIAQRRRRKAGATVAASVLAVGAIIGVPVVSHLSAEPQPAQQGPFPDKIDGDTKIASTMGDEGDTKVTLEFTPEDTDFLLKIDCDDLAPKNNSTKELKAAPNVQVSVNDVDVNPACGVFHEIGVSMGLTGDVATREQVREFWEQGGATAGKEVTVTLQVNQGLSERPREEPIDGQIGVAVYDMTGARSTSNGAAFPTTKTLGDKTYELGGFDADTDKSMTASVRVPRGDEPALVTYGTRSHLGGVRKVTVDGRQGILTGKGGIFTEPLPDSRAHNVRIKDNGSIGDHVVVAYYTRVGLSFPETTDARDPLVASDVGEPGETVFRTTFTADDANLALTGACTASRDSDDIAVSLSINGHGGIISGRCGSLDGEVHFNDQPGANRQTWSKYGVVPGEPVDVVIRAQSAKGTGASLDDVQLGFAAYERSAPRTKANGFRIDDCQRRNGDWYELDDYETVDVTDATREASLRVPETGDHVLVGYGYSGGRGGLIRTVVDGRTIVYGKPGTSAFGYEGIDGDAHEIAIKAGRKVNGGKLVIAYYVPEK